MKFTQIALNKALTVIIVVSMLSGCVAPNAPTPAPAASQQDPYLSALDKLTANMPDKIAQKIAQSHPSFLRVIQGNPLLRDILPKDNYESLQTLVQEALGLDWKAVTSVQQLKQMLLTSVVTDINRLLANAKLTYLSLIGNSGPSHENTTSGAFLDSLMAAKAIENLSGVPLPVSPSDKWTQFMLCTTELQFQDMDDCDPTAEEGAGVPPPVSSDCQDGKTPKGEPCTSPSPEKDPLDAGANAYDAANTPDAQAHSSTDEEKTWFENVPWKDISLDTVYLVSGAVALAFPQLAAASLIIGYVSVQYLRIVYRDTKQCPRPYDSVLPEQHPLIGKNFLVEGNQVDAVALFERCGCGLDNNSIPAWMCGPDEQRFDCLRNPYGPDDRPRPECLIALAGDNNVPTNTLCQTIQCSPEDDLNPLTCECSSKEDAPIPNLTRLQQMCGATDCGPNQFMDPLTCACIDYGNSMRINNKILGEYLTGVLTHNAEVLPHNPNDPIIEVKVSAQIQSDQIILLVTKPKDVLTPGESIEIVANMMVENGSLYLAPKQAWLDNTPVMLEIVHPFMRQVNDAIADISPGRVGGIKNGEGAFIIDHK